MPNHLPLSNSRKVVVFEELELSVANSGTNKFIVRPDRFPLGRSTLYKTVRRFILLNLHNIRRMDLLILRTIPSDEVIELNGRQQDTNNSGPAMKLEELLIID